MHWIYIPRPRLLTCFRDDLPFTFIYGIPGSGKTQLLKEWIQAQNISVVWLTCSDNDNDPICFWQHLMQAFSPTMKHNALIASPFPSNLETAVIALVRWIEEQQQNMHLILDDYHLIQAEETQRVIRDLLHRRPARLHTAITSRVKDIQLPLKRWVLEDQLAVISPSDLAFTLDETRQAILASSALLTEADIQLLHRSTGGWITGIKLALMRKGQPFTQDSSSLYHPRQLTEALCEDVFHALTPTYRTFALQTSILDVLNADICHAITKNEQSSLLIEALVDYGLLLPLDSQRQTFRYLDFWQAFLCKHLEHSATLHSRAALWYRTSNDMDQAISHALYGDSSLAAELIREHGCTKIARGELTTLRRWLTSLSESVIQADAELCMLHAWALVHAGELDLAERYLHHPAQMQGEVNAVRARIAGLRGDKQAMINFSNMALLHIPETEFSLRADMALNLGCAYLEEGRVTQAQYTLTDALRMSRTAQQERAEIFAVYFLGKVATAQGRLQQALLLYQAGLHAHRDVSLAGVFHVGMADIYYEQNDLDRAKQQLEQAVKMGEQGGEIKPLVYANIALGLMLTPQEAVQRLEYAISLTSWTLLYAWQAIWWLRAGNTCMASYWLEDTRAHPEQCSELERLVQARTLLALKRGSEAAQLLDTLQANACEHQRYGDLIRILLLQAQRHKAQGRNAEALQCVAQAIERGQQERYIRTFLDEGEPIYQLCKRLSDQQPENHYLKHIVQQFTYIMPQIAPDPFGESLSQRELEVLLLIAEGASNDDIAGQLFLTVGTVKWHVHNIFGKLDVKNRTRAVKKARELGVLVM